MRVLKALLGLALLGTTVAVWTHRDPVVDAYTAERAPLELHFDGFEVAVQRADLGPSPYLITTEAPDLTSTDPGAVRALPRPAVAASMAGGSGRLSGLVTGPSGIVPGATVIVERHTLDGSDRVTLQTDAEGTFSLEGLIGGRYRIRAYAPQSLAMESAAVLFLAEGQEQDLRLATRAARPGLVVDLVAGGPVLVGTSFTVAVSVGREAVDELGRLVITPVPAVRVDVRPAGTAVLESVPVVSTDSAGAARFGLRCDAPGSSSILATVGGVAPTVEAPTAPPPQYYRLDVPPCVVSAPDTETDSTDVPAAPSAGPFDD